MDDRIKDLVTVLLRDRMAAITSLFGGRFLHLILDSSRTKTETNLVSVSTPILLNVIIFLLCFSLFDDKIQKMAMRVPREYRVGFLIDFCV